MGRKIAVRTRYFDDFILDCCSSTSSSSPTSKGRRRLRRLLAALFGRRHPQPPRPTPAAITQVLILGCGMDTRAWRLQLPNTTIVEVDVAPVLRAKEAVLREVQAQRRRDGLGPIPLTVGARQVIPADLADPEDDWPRRVARVVDVTRPVAVVIEGLLMYLREKEVGALLARVGALAAAPGSRVGVSLVDWRSVRDAQASTSPLRRAWRWGCDERACGPFFEGALSTGGGGRTGEWGVTHKVTVGKEGGYPDGANYACWRNVGKWKRVGKTLYVLAERTGERRKRGR